MDTWIVSNKDIDYEEFQKIPREKIADYWEEKLFAPLEELAATTLKDQLLIVNRLFFIGVVVVQATHTAVKSLQDAGYRVSPNEKHRLL